MPTKKCRKEYMRDYAKEYYKRPENRARRLEKEKLSTQRNREAYKKWKSSLVCSLCDEKEACCLEFHHLDPAKKDFAIAKKSGQTLALIMKEVEKCIVLCSNCHKKVHAGILKIETEKVE